MKKIVRVLLVLFVNLLLLQGALAQKPEKWSSADIYHAIKKLNVLGSALYIAAHPDDENTRLISHLSNGMYVNTAYLSLTRGDGGQNLVGPEIRELLGVIRTQELLAARRIDGGSQMFSRANDFGYSKSPEETQQIWDKEEVMADIVWAIRKWKPDVIVNRFSHDSGRRTHGHHTSSAQLSVEAFDLAGDPSAFPGQLNFVQAWQPKRLFFNTSWWFYGGRDEFNAADKSNMVVVDAGMYYPLKGKSNNEIAAESRSMHKSQGFGTIGSRGEELEYLEFIKGDKPGDQTDLFEGINTTWTRVKGGEAIGEILKKAEENFDYEKPYASVPLLMQAYEKIRQLEDDYWREVKTNEIKRILAACMGLFMEAVADDYSATPGQQVELAIEVINRSPVDCRLQSVQIFPTGFDTLIQEKLVDNQVLKFWQKVILPEDLPLTNAYWLNDQWELGMYKVEDQLLRGLPETPKSFRARFDFVVEGETLSFIRDVVYKYDDDVKGEVYRPFEVTPPVFVSLTEDVYLFTNSEPKEVEVVVKSGAPQITGSLTLARPKGWRIEPEKISFELKLKGEEQTVRFMLYPPEKEAEGKISPIAYVGGEGYTRSLAVIGYDHIPTQSILLNSETRIAKMDLKKAGNKVAYIMGAGDMIPESLRQIGYDVDLLEDRDITPENLKRYDAVILGVRAYNTVERLKFHQADLFEYVYNGGTMIVQYNTNRSLVLPMEEIAPYPLNISRDRVAEEDAEVRFLLPEHEVLNFPNRITQADFEGWVQERGLYFPDEWSSEYEAVLSSNDTDEPPRDGGLLVAKYGKGYYIYTGYSWFRELPAGVTGAYRLFANLISVGKQDKY